MGNGNILLFLTCITELAENFVALNIFIKLIFILRFTYETPVDYYT